MKKIILISVIVALSGMFLGSCATGASKAYLDANTLWCHNTLQLCAELTADKYKNSGEKSQGLMLLATYECSWDVEKKKSTLEYPSQSCKCAFATDKNERIVECDKWLEDIREKGGCYEK